MDSLKNIRNALDTDEMPAFFERDFSAICTLSAGNHTARFCHFVYSILHSLPTFYTEDQHVQVLAFIAEKLTFSEIWVNSKKNELRGQFGKYPLEALILQPSKSVFSKYIKYSCLRQRLTSNARILSAVELDSLRVMIERYDLMLQEIIDPIFDFRSEAGALSNLFSPLQKDVGVKGGAIDALQNINSYYSRYSITLRPEPEPELEPELDVRSANWEKWVASARQFSVKRFRKEEIEYLLEYVDRGLLSSNSELASHAAVLFSMFCFSISREQAVIMLGSNHSDIKSGVINRSIPEIKVEIPECQYESVKMLTLRVPARLVYWAKKHTLNNLSPESFDIYLKSLREPPIGKRLKQQSITAHLKHLCNVKYGCTLTTFLLINGECWSRPLVSRYTSISINTVKQRWSELQSLQGCELIGQDEYDFDVYGVAFNRQFVRNFFDLKSKVLDDAELYDFHNHYVLYVLTLLMTSVGARPVIRPLTDIRMIDLRKGIITIDDKDTAQNSCRHIPLAKEAIKQIEFYLEHLKLLASRLYRREGNRPLIKALVTLSAFNRSSIPLFFQLNKDYSVTDITPTVLKEYLAPLPDNIGRKLFASMISDELGVNSCRAFLGHGDVSPEFLSRFIESPIEKYNSVVDVVDRGLANLGLHATPGLTGNVSKELMWRVNEGKLRARKGEGLPYKKNPNSEDKLKEFFKKCRNAVDDFKKIIQENKAANYDDIVELAVRYNISPDRLYSYLKRARIIDPRSYKDTHSSRKAGKDAMPKIKEVEKTRADFQAVFKVHKITELDEGNVANLLILSLLLFSYVADRLLLRSLLVSLTECPLKEGESVIAYDFNGTQKSTFRLDPITSMIACSGTPSVGKKAQKIVLGKEFKFTGKLKGLNGLLPKVPTLIESKNIDNLLALNGLYVFSLGAGTGHAPLGPKSIARLLNQKSLRQVNIHDVAPLKDRLNLRKRGKGALKIELDKYSKLEEVKRKAVKSTKAKKHYELFLRNILDNVPLTEIGFLLCQWGIRLIQVGTIRQSVVIGTVRDYLGMVVSVVEPEFKTDSLIELDVNELNARFKKVIAAKHEENQKVAGRIIEFIAFLEMIEIIPELDEEYLLDGLSQYRGKSRNVIICEWEYQSLLKILIESGNVKSALYALLLYRFGLRDEEAQFLYFRDIIKTKEGYYLTVYQNEQRRLKTVRSKRIVHLLESLPKHELELLDGVIEEGQDIERRFTKKGFIFYKNFDVSYDLAIDKYLISNLIKELSGDNQICLHSFRHTYANRIIAHYYLAQGQESKVLDAITSSNKLSIEFDEPFSIYELLSQQLGHENVRSTLDLYDHITMLVEQDNNANNLWAELASWNSSILANLAGVTSGAIRKSRSRRSKRKALSVAPANYETICSEFELLDTHSLELVEKPKENDLLLLDRILTSYLEFSPLVSGDITEELHRKTIKAAISIERTTGLTPYNVAKRLDFEPSARKIEFGVSEQQRMLQLCKSFNWKELEARRDDISALIRANKFTKNGLECFDEQDADDAINLFVEFFSDYVEVSLKQYEKKTFIDFKPTPKTLTKKSWSRLLYLILLKTID